MKANRINLNLIVVISLVLTISITGCMDNGGAEPNSSSSSSNGNFSESEKSPNSCTRKSYGNPNFQCDCSGVEIDLPLDYSINAGQFTLNTPAGPVDGSVGVFGAHTDPFTGHYTGNHKSDWKAQYGGSRLSDLTELRGDGDGVCEPGEKCGVHRTEIEGHDVRYISPGNSFYVTDVIVGTDYPKLANEFSASRTYEVKGWICNYRYSMGYIQKISPDLRDKMILAGYGDPNLADKTNSTLPGNRGYQAQNLITGTPIILDKGEEIGILQIRTEPVAGYNNYFSKPWSAIEFNLDNFSLENGANGGIYRYLPENLKDQLQDALDNEIREGQNSVRFGQYHYHQWLWGAEAKLSPSQPVKQGDYSSIHSFLGGWAETNSTKDCVGWHSQYCNQQLSIFKIQKDSIAYDPGNYESSDVNYLFFHKPDLHLSAGEVLTPSKVNDIKGTLTIKWRSNTSGFQRISYQVFPAQKIMKMHFGSVKQFQDELDDPAIPTSDDICDGTTIICLDHENHF